MKWLFLVNNAQFLSEFFGKISEELIKEGDQCAVVINSKLAEHEKIGFFPQESKIISKVDWCVKNYNNKKESFSRLTWRELFVFFARYDKFYSGKIKSKEYLEAANQLCQFFDYVFKTEKPDIVVGEGPSGLFGLTAYDFCKENKVVFCGIVESRIPGKIDTYDLSWTNTKYEETFLQIKREDFLPEEIEFAENFVKKLTLHEIFYSSCYVCKVRFGFLDFMKHYLKRTKESGNSILQYFFMRKNFKYFDYESESIFKYSFMAPIKMIKRELRIPFQNFFFEKLVLEDRYFFFPLQYEPEASTLILATYYSNQLYTIKNVANTLPLPYKLYVKEHPGSIGTRSNSFYKELKKIPNVVLLSSEESTPKIIRGACGIITSTSTVGLEATLIGKPVYVLGNVFYSYHPFCRKVVNFEDLREKINTDLMAKLKISDLQELNLRFVISYIRNNFFADMFFQKGKEDSNNYKLICQYIKKSFLK